MKRTQSNRTIFYAIYTLVLLAMFTVQIVGSSSNRRIEASFTARDGWVTVNTTLNIRSGAGTNHSVVGSLNRNAQVRIIGESGNWWQIGSNPNRFVSKDFIALTSSAQQRTITWNANGGSVSPATWTRNQGTPMGALPTPTRSGHTFAGWFTAQTGGTQVNANTAVPNGNVT